MATAVPISSRSVVRGRALDMAGNGAFILSVQTGLLAIAAVLSSLYPVMTVVLAVAFLRERVTGVHVFGIGLAAAAVAIIALGSASLPAPADTTDPTRRHARDRLVRAGHLRPGRRGDAGAAAPRHLARIAELRAAGRTSRSAPSWMRSSVLLIRAETEAEALDVCRADVYMQSGSGSARSRSGDEPPGLRTAVWVELRLPSTPISTLNEYPDRRRPGLGRAEPEPGLVRRIVDARGGRTPGRSVRDAANARGSLALDLGRIAQDTTVEPLRVRRAVDEAKSPRCANDASGTARRDRAAFRARTTLAPGPARWPSPERRPPRRGSGAPPGARVTFVASTTVGRRREPPLEAGAGPRTRAGWRDWSAASPDDRSRNASEERTRRGRSGARRTWTCPTPAAPTSTTRHGSGRAIAGIGSMRGIMPRPPAGPVRRGA